MSRSSKGDAGMPGDERRNQRVSLTIKYSQEISENEIPEPSQPGAIIGPTKDTLERGHVNRVYYFLVSSSTACLTAVALVPNPTVAGAAGAVWVGSVGLGKYLLRDTYRKPKKQN